MIFTWCLPKLKDIRKGKNSGVFINLNRNVESIKGSYQNSQPYTLNLEKHPSNPNLLNLTNDIVYDQTI